MTFLLFNNKLEKNIGKMVDAGTRDGRNGSSWANSELSLGNQEVSIFHILVINTSSVHSLRD